MQLSEEMLLFLYFPRRSAGDTNIIAQEEKKGKSSAAQFFQHIAQKRKKLHVDVQLFPCFALCIEGTARHFFAGSFGSERRKGKNACRGLCVRIRLYRP